MDKENKQERLALIIDAENTQASIIEPMLVEIAKYGTAVVKRIYGDWTTPNLRSWKECLLQFAIQPIQQFRYTTGKNASDSSMIIDAMDLLYTGKYDGFCIVSSDSDFTRLASRIRESGLTVYGIGESKTPKSFISACDKFIYTEILLKDESMPAPNKETLNELKGDTQLVVLLRKAAEASADEDGWSYLAKVGVNIANQAPEFDPRNYGYRKLGELIKACQLFDVDERITKDSQSPLIYIRDKRKK
jgi:uncharacterized LabA/DUF88 family protein